MTFENVPEALALIPDGNRRWAKGHGISFQQSYNQGVNKFIDFSEWCLGYGINNLTVWAFSTENFKRPSLETHVLFDIYRKVAKDSNIVGRLHDNETRFVVVGNRALLPKDLMQSLHKLELDTKKYTGRVINMLIGYGGRDDILFAAKALVKDAIDRKIRTVNEALLRSYLLSSVVPDADLVIRTSGEQRLSGLMPWQSGYSELYFSKKMWPEFTKRDLNSAIKDYSDRQRRFGK